MDLRDARPHLNLYNAYWPLRTAYYDQPPAKFVFDENGRRGLALHSVIGEGCIVSGGAVRNSVLGRSVFVHSYSLVEDSVIMDYAEIGRHAKIRRAIIDKNVYHSRRRRDRIRPRARPAAILRHRFGPGRDSQGPQARTVGTVDGASFSVSKSKVRSATNRRPFDRRHPAPRRRSRRLDRWRPAEVRLSALARKAEEHAHPAGTQGSAHLLDAGRRASCAQPPARFHPVQIGDRVRLDFPSLRQSSQANRNPQSRDRVPRKERRRARRASCARRTSTLAAAAPSTFGSADSSTAGSRAASPTIASTSGTSSRPGTPARARSS